MTTDTQPVPAHIQDATRRVYRQLRDAGYLSHRPGQQRMIARVAGAVCKAAQPIDKASNPGRLIAIHAGTGAGKSMGYGIGCIPAALANNFKVIIATATVALMEQLAKKDLPTLQAQIPGMTFAIAKGRNRYMCPQKTSQHLTQVDTDKATHATITMWDKALKAGTWDGDKDSFTEPPCDLTWKKVTVESSQCAGRTCSKVGQCPYYRNKAQIDASNVIVTNFDLLLQDTAQSGSVLPELEECILIVDEGHGLHQKALRMLGQRFNLSSGPEWCSSAIQLVARIVRTKLVGEWTELARSAMDYLMVFQSALACMESALSKDDRVLKACDSDKMVFVPFEEGRLPGGIMRAAIDCAQSAQYCANLMHELRKSITGQDAGRLSTEDRQRWLMDVGGLMMRAEQAAGAWAMFAQESKSDMPIAKWIEITPNNHLEVHVNASPLMADEGLKRLLWDKVAGAIICSATLKSVGGFTPFLRESGLALMGGVSTLDIESPFNYAAQGKLLVPNMRSTPKDTKLHTEEISHLIPSILRQVPQGSGALVIFTSWSKLKAVAMNMPEEIAAEMLVQGDLSKAELLKRHRAAIESGKRSIIFGTQSFEEGVDLPGRLCELVIIEKLPFKVPTHPVDIARMEWMRAKGMDHFALNVVPEAAKRLTQGAGRLIRTESDHGAVVILDPRLCTTGYGRDILEALPPFPLERSTNLSFAAA